MDILIIPSFCLSVADFSFSQLWAWSMSEAHNILSLPSGFAIVFALVNPFFGHLSDQISRRTLMCLGVTYWTLFVASCSVIPQEWGWTIPFIRSAVAAIESFFAGISLTLIDDLCPPENRRGPLCMFNSFSYIMG
ncbi:protein spinster homolog 1-like isoform X1 [Xenopus laevis]|uniref:Protein spinster homolog 1-like isoform X1 n=1 Tax=Xenopus laevis TaxID=8355 RepID=A0A8J1MW09_XENLA|nr:protein spinster homolog 1-like isoform X1 [Xenopus laevis]